MRKRSSLLAAFLATAAITPLLSACGDPPSPPKPTVYNDVASCIATNPDKKAECEKAFAGSATAHQASAPQYTDKARCEAEFGTGNCETRTSSSGGSTFMPMMMGYMLGSMNSGPNYYPVYYNTGGGVYSGRDRVGTVPVTSIPSHSTPGYGGSARASTTTSFAPSSSFSSAKSSYAASGSSSRGGFGATASARGGCCG